MTITRSLVLTAGAIAVLSMFLGGCGGPSDSAERAAVSGVVTFDREPLKSGVIRFVPKPGTTGSPWSTEVVDGSFSAEATTGPPVGEYLVEIDLGYSDEFAMDDEEALERLEQSGEEIADEIIVIPRIYNTNTTLSATITHDAENVLNFDLESQE